MAQCKDCGCYVAPEYKSDLCIRCEEEYQLSSSVTKEEPTAAKQIGGSHYAKQGIEPIDYIMKNNLGFNEGNVVKYITRHKDKNGAEDIKKAIHYLEFILKYEYGENR